MKKAIIIILIMIPAVFIGFTSAIIQTKKEIKSKIKTLSKIESDLIPLSDDGVYNFYGDGMDKDILLDCYYNSYIDIMPISYDTFKATGGKL